MNQTINLITILKDVPKGTKLYHSVYGDVTLVKVSDDGDYPITVEDTNHGIHLVAKNGKMNIYFRGDCILFPSKENRNWEAYKFDLPIDTPVVVQISDTEYLIRYYAGNNRCFIDGYKLSDNIGTAGWNVIIPFDKFNPNNIEESLKYNIVK